MASTLIGGIKLENSVGDVCGKVRNTAQKESVTEKQEESGVVLHNWKWLDNPVKPKKISLISFMATICCLSVFFI